MEGVFEWNYVHDTFIQHDNPYLSKGIFEIFPSFRKEMIEFSKKNEKYLT